jgi:hypothetical protein
MMPMTHEHGFRQIRPRIPQRVASTLSEQVLRGQLPSDAREALTQTQINHEAFNMMSMY